MKIKLEGKGLSILKHRDNYRKWKQDVQLLIAGLGVSYLLTPPEPLTPPLTTPTPSSSSSSAQPANISTVEHEGEGERERRRGKERDGEEDFVSKERWVKESDQVVAQLYFFVSPLYQPLILNLKPKNLPHLFQTFDKQFINSDTMMLVSKRTELDAYRLKLDKTFHEQIIKFEELTLHYKEMGGTISDNDLTYLLIKALPDTYKEKLSNLLSLKAGQITFEEVKASLLTIYERDMAWHLLPTTKEPPPTAEAALFGQGKGKWEGKGKGKGKEKWDKGEKGKTYKDPKQFDIKYICFNCPRTDHKTKDCPQPLTLEARHKQAAWWEERKKQNKGKKEGGGGPPKRAEKDASCLALNIPSYYFSDLHSPLSTIPSPLHTPALAVHSLSAMPTLKVINMENEQSCVSCLSPSINLFFGESLPDTYKLSHNVPSHSVLACTNPDPISGHVETGVYAPTLGKDCVVSDLLEIGNLLVIPEPGSLGVNVEDGMARSEVDGARRTGEGLLPCGRTPPMQYATSNSPETNSEVESTANLHSCWRWEERLGPQVMSPLHSRVKHMWSDPIGAAPRLELSPATEKGLRVYGLVLTLQPCGVVRPKGISQTITEPPPLKQTFTSGEASGEVIKFNAAIHEVSDVDPFRIVVARDTALVGEHRNLLTMSDFDFAPQVAPTPHQLFPNLQTHTVLIAARGEGFLIDPKFDWIVDSGCTSHMSNNPSLFTELRPHNSTITTAGTATQVTGIGTARLRAELKDEITNFTLQNTLLVPSLPVNLISQSKLESKFYITTQHGYQVRSRQTNDLFMEARIIQGLYVVKQERVFDKSLLAKESLQLWHERMGHINVQRLKLMRDGSAIGVKFTDAELSDFQCDACILGKAHRAPIHNKPVEKCDTPGQRLHWDTCGPIKPSLGKSIYMVIGVDEATNYYFIGFHKSKDTIPQTIIDTITKIDKMRGANTVKAIHSDGGGEFVSKDTAKWLASQGIKHTWSAAKTPEHNGKAERAIQSVVSSARCMLINSGLLITFWAEAVRMSCIVHNLAPTKANGNAPPALAWDNKPPNVSSIRTFGCRVLVKDPEPPGKFSVRTWDGIYMGPAEGGDGHKIYDPATKRMNTTRDVFFLEGRAKPQLHLSPLLEGRAREGKGDGENMYVGDLYHPREETEPGRNNPEDLEEEEDEEPLKRAFSLPPGVGIPRKGSNKVGKKAAYALDPPAPHQPAPPPPPVHIPAPPSPPVLTPQPTPPPTPPATPQSPQQPFSPPPASPASNASGSTASNASERDDRDERAESDPEREETDDDERDDAPELRRSARVTKGKISKDYWMNKPRDEAGHGLCAFTATEEEFPPHPPTHDGIVEPASYEQATQSPQRAQWLQAMKDEMTALTKLKTFELAQLPKGRKAIGSKWVFRIKRGDKGEITRYKARLVAQGFTQRKGTDFHDTFAPVARMTSQRIVIAIAAHRHYSLFTIDISNAYLNSEIDVGSLYMRQPKGFEDPRYPTKSGWACRLLKSLYGLKQAGNIWNANIHSYILELGFTRTHSDLCVYTKDQIVLALHVDDFLVASTHQSFDWLVSQLQQRFSLSHKEADICLGIKIVPDTSYGFTIGQQHYLESLLVEFGMQDCKPAPTPLAKGEIDALTAGNTGGKPLGDKEHHLYRQIVGKLMYAMVGTRPDLAYALSVLGKYSDAPDTFHLGMAKRLLGYVKGSINLKMHFRGSSDPSVPLILSGYVDSDYANSEERKSTTGFCFFLQSNLIGWCSKKQPTVATSTTVAEYFALYEATTEAVCLRTLLDDLRFPQKDATMIHADNQTAIKLAEDETSHKRTKHIAVKYRYTKEQQDLGSIYIEYVPTQDNLADFFTKQLARVQHQESCKRLGLFL